MRSSFKIILCSFSFLGLGFLPSVPTQADDAAVLPEGRFRLRLIGSFTQTSNELSGSGTTISSGAMLSRKLDSKLITALNPEAQELVRALNAIQPGLGDNFNVATLNTDINTNIISNILVLEYGITDRFSVGAIMPILYGEVEVTPTLEEDPRFARLPESVKSQLAAFSSVAGLNSVLKNQFGYKDGLDTWSGAGIGDLELGAKYNYYRAAKFRSTVKGGLRLPTGREDDPDLLFDVGFGDGQVDLGIYHYADYFLTPDLYFSTELGYVAQLPHTISKRVPSSSELPIGANKVSFEEDLGDYWDAGIEMNLTVAKYWSFTPRYQFRQKFKDSYKSSVIDGSLLEAGTFEETHEFRANIEFSNLPDVRAGLSRFPYGIAAFYRQPIAGTNIPDVRTAGVILKTFF